ncbi:MAG: hypothetical protein V1809_07900 [Planctomycetota bacterium]
MGGTLVGSGLYLPADVDWLPEVVCLLDQLIRYSARKDAVSKVSITTEELAKAIGGK